MKIAPEQMEGDRRLKRLTERKRDASIDDLNSLLAILDHLVSHDGALLSQFIRVSDIAAVQSQEESGQVVADPTRHAKKYVENQREEVQAIIWKLLEGLLPSVEYHRESDYIYFHQQDHKDWSVYVRARPRGRRVDVIFEAEASEPVSEDQPDDTYFKRMKSSGCPNPQERYNDWEARYRDKINCSLEETATPAQVEAVQQFVRWFVVDAPKLCDKE